MLRCCEIDSLSETRTAPMAAPQATMGIVRADMPRHLGRIQEVLRARCYGHRMEHTCCHWGFSREK
ncbi:MAG: hypothetical protein ABFE13_22235 [Phycisphaerales bacterium]